jgi:hypothetical protein
LNWPPSATIRSSACKPPPALLPTPSPSTRNWRETLPASTATTRRAAPPSLPQDRPRTPKGWRIGSELPCASKPWAGSVPT